MARRLLAGAGPLLLFALLAIGAGLALLTRFPESAAAERVGEWPLVGRLVEAVRRPYLQPVAGAPAVPGVRPPETIVVGEARPIVWVDEGSVLREQPEEAAAPVATVEALTNLPVFERRDPWALVEHRGARGWVVPRPPSTRPALGGRPAPVLPVAARVPDPKLLALGRERLAAGGVDHPLGGYRLWTDWSGAELVARCRRLESGLEAAYVARYGVEPVGEPAEVVLLFADRDDYDAFARESTARQVDSAGHADRGVVATFVGLRTPAEVCATVAHELVHLLNRRSIGPALPPWLEEGLATDLAASESGLGLVVRVVRYQARQGRLPSLGTLVALEEGAFHAAPSRRLHYQLSGLFVAFLLDEPRSARGFRAFVRYLAAGGPYGPENVDGPTVAVRESIGLEDDLGAFLGAAPETFDEPFRRWLDRQPPGRP